MILKLDVYIKSSDKIVVFVCDTWVVSEGQLIIQTVIDGYTYKTVVAPGEWAYLIERAA